MIGVIGGPRQRQGGVVGKSDEKIGGQSTGIAAGILNKPRKKRHGAAALQNLAEIAALWNSRQRRGVRQPYAAFSVFVKGAHHTPPNHFSPKA